MNNYKVIVKETIWYEFESIAPCKSMVITNDRLVEDNICETDVVIERIDFLNPIKEEVVI